MGEDKYWLDEIDALKADNALLRGLLCETLLARKRSATLGIWKKIDTYFGLVGRYTGPVYHDDQRGGWTTQLTLSELKEYVDV